jgi:REP element-mobilizing transposase RayT
MDASLRANQWTIDLQTLVVMPDHVHMIFTPLVDLERAEIFCEHGTASVEIVEILP